MPVLFAALVTFLILSGWLWADTTITRNGPSLATLAGYDAVVDELDDRPRPLLLLLHADGSDALATLPLVAGLTGARVLAPYGQHTSAAGRGFVERCGSPLEWRCAIRREAAELEGLLAAALERWPTKGQIVVVGIGEGGATLALTLGFTSPLVSTALAFGGSFPLTLVPSQEYVDDRCDVDGQTRLRKAGWGATTTNDGRVETLARLRGFDFRVDINDDFEFQDPFHWLLPQLQAAFEESDR